MNYSEKRERVKEQMKDRFDHPTAYTIYEELLKKDKRVSLATVYRHLNKLVEMGELRRLSLDDGDHFDPVLKEHHHFVCDKCGTIYDITANHEFDKIDSIVTKKYAKNITTRELIMHGKCKKCR